MTILVRQASLADVPAIADVHVMAWRESYRGIMPDAVIAARGPRERASLWRNVLTRPSAATDVFVAEADGKVVGFASCGPAADGAGAEREVYAIYVLKRWQCRGIGSRLMRAMGAALVGREAGSVGLWVARANLAAIVFYRALGGTIGLVRHETWSGHALVEIGLMWGDASDLATWDNAAVSSSPLPRRRAADGEQSRSAAEKSTIVASEKNELLCGV
jgi:ribosomal protein S18 acetylase RimI-like enzyme